MSILRSSAFACFHLSPFIFFWQFVKNAHVSCIYQIFFVPFVNGGRIAGSFAEQIVGDGIGALWIFGQGTVTVAEDGTITVDALNTKGTAIKVVLHKQPTAIDVTVSPQNGETLDGKGSAIKRIENGLLIIRNNGSDYNAQGALIR